MKKNILIISTDCDISKSIKQNLTCPSTNILCVSSMHEALLAIKDTELCLIILDVSISAEDNHRFLSAIRKSKTVPILIIDPLARQVLLNGKDLHLTRKEFDLLFCLASNPGQVFSREQLYSHVWGEHSVYNIDEVVKAQIKTLRQKLSTTGNEYIKNVWGIGYRFYSEPDDE